MLREKSPCINQSEHINNMRNHMWSGVHACYNIDAGVLSGKSSEIEWAVGVVCDV